MSEPENTKVIRQAYDNFQTGNIPALLQLFAEDIGWNFPATPGVPYAGNRQGSDQVAQFFAQLNEAAECLDFNPREYTASGEKVVAQGTYTFRTRDGGREYTCEFAHVFAVRDGVICQFQEYADTAAIMVAYQKAMAA
jgi:hypothetical protein